MNNMIKQLFANELQEFLLNNPDGLLLDVRQPFEFEEISLKHAKLIPLGELHQRLPEILEYKHKPVIVYCKAGVRSMTACKILEEDGFSNLYNLNEGIIAFY
ncbi:MAG: rhodanese-like domain-containing protein [Burkholderiales bacterium]|nr:rhodanese-like domain-containing protein [Burkholderiales bacterium]